MLSCGGCIREALRFNPFMPSELFHLNSVDRSISSRRGVQLVFNIRIFYRDCLLNANSVDSDQTLKNAVSNLGLHCLSVSCLWDARHKWLIRNRKLIMWLVCLSTARSQAWKTYRAQDKPISLWLQDFMDFNPCPAEPGYTLPLQTV